MSEMVDRVAQAILAVNVPRANWDYCKSVPDHPLYTQSIELARAAIEAMREPTEAMIEAGSTAADHEFGTIGLEAAKEAWNLMIDEALR
jgi:hypothetical protein